MYKKLKRMVWFFGLIVCEWLVLVTFGMYQEARSDEPIKAVFQEEQKLVFTNPFPTTTSSNVPDEFKDLVWNKWDTDNFIVLSISEQQGLYLKNNIERIKSSLLKNWGIKDFDLSKKCKLVCVSNEEMLDKLFKKQDFHSEVRKDSDGNIESNAIWFYLDDTNAMGKLNDKVLDICLSELSQKVKSIPAFCRVGMCVLSKNSNQIKETILKGEDANASDLITSEKPELSEGPCAALCLMIRKEYGENNFLSYLLTGDLKSLGINDENQLDSIFNRYKDNLKKDLSNNLVPANYLKIESSN